MKVIFKKNDIPYMQDHKIYKGIPEKITFKLELLIKDRIKLVGKGYGSLSGKDYGNGALFVRIKDLPQKIINKINKEDFKIIDPTWNSINILPKVGIEIEYRDHTGDTGYAYLCPCCKDEWRCPISGGVLMINVVKWRYAT